MRELVPGNGWQGECSDTLPLGSKEVLEKNAYTHLSLSLSLLHENRSIKKVETNQNGLYTIIHTKYEKGNKRPRKTKHILSHQISASLHNWKLHYNPSIVSESSCKEVENIQAAHSTWASINTVCATRDLGPMARWVLLETDRTVERTGMNQA